jgi:glyoxylase-like metal-dependent hydrolase (beta-lactamase superfamily II)
LSRRALLIDLGATAAAALVLGACGSDTPLDDVPADDPTAAGPEADATVTEQTTVAGRWQRSDLGFVSAYVLVRAGEAVLVDSGPSGSEGTIAGTLTALGTGWSDVSDVILTHRHGDHIGSLGAVAVAAAQASMWAGIDDVDAVGRDLGLNGVGDRDQIAGLTVIATPGHTAGHISILDPAAGVLVAGDALNGENGGVTGPNPQFTSDMDIANASVAALAGFDYQTIYFGHGEPVLDQGSDLVAELAATL